MRGSRIETAWPVTRDWLGTDAKVLRHVRVCGDGRLAVATRLELERLGIQRDSDYLLPSLRPTLVIACADGEADNSFADAAQQAAQDGCPLLFACLAGRAIRLGPLIEPSGCWVGAGSALQSADATPVPPQCPTTPTAVPQIRAETAAPLGFNARLGALLVSAQALNFVLGARSQCVLDRVVELNPWSMESKGYRVLKVRQ